MIVNGIVSLISFLVKFQCLCIETSEISVYLFCILQLHQIHCTIFRIFYVYYHIIHEQWKLYFSSNLDSFSFSSLIVVARISKSMLSKSGNSGHPCLVPEFRMPSAFLSCFHISDKDVNCRFVMYGLYYVEVSFLYVHFLEFFFFIIHWCWILYKKCFCIYGDNYIVFIFQFGNVVYHIDWYACI